jgi:hypothetical protein
MKTLKKISKEKQLGFGSNLMKKICICDLGYGVDRLGLDGMNKDYYTNTSTQM